MFNIRVVRTIPKPVNVVFAILVDHEGYARFPGVDHARIVEPGDTSRNGVGALREVHIGPVRFWERITVVEPNVRLSYHIEQSRPFPMDHKDGTLMFESLDTNETRVTWTSDGHITIPLIGGLIDRVLERQGNTGFSVALKAVGRL
ncbi:MAG: SRPBCC family protein [Myxococcota bacterium]